MAERIEIMTPEHPRWDEFVERLGGPEGCDWVDDSWKCGGTEFRFSRAILASMIGVDVEGSIAFFAANGGGRDCEILLNIDATLDVELVH